MMYRLIAPIDPQLSPIEQVLMNRGIQKDQILRYLNTSANDILPFNDLDNLEAGAKMLISHIAQNHKIFVQADPDVDGYTSTACLLNYLYDLFPGFVQNNILYRTHDSKYHGLLLETIPEDVKLVIAPDSSSNQYDVHKELYNRGIDVLVIDHHEAEYVSPHACVINNQLCQYENKQLSGVGVVYKFCCYLDSLMGINNAEKYLDLVAIGMIADMMALTSFETKELIVQGLKAINNPFMAAVVERNYFVFQKGIVPERIAFYLAPLINAVARTGTPSERRVLLEAMLEYKAYTKIPSTKRGCTGQMEMILEQAVRMCGNVKNRQTTSRDNATAVIEELIESNHLLENKILVVQLTPKNSVDKNLTGLIANELMSRYQRPVLILNQKKDEDGITWEGSGRGYEKSRLSNFRGFLLETGLIEWAEGHANAFGCCIKNENIARFITVTNYLLSNFDFSPVYPVDFIYNSNQVNPQDLINLASYEELWGEKMDTPMVAIENVKITSGNVFLLGENKTTLKIVLPNGIELIKFKSSDEEYQLLYSEIGCVIINVVGQCSVNTWAGETTPQILIKDFEVIGKQKYYF